jgi:hypothetical protein
MITELFTRIRFLVSRKKTSEVDDELRFHRVSLPHSLLLAYSPVGFLLGALLLSIQ